MCETKSEKTSHSSSHALKCKNKANSIAEIKALKDTSFKNLFIHSDLTSMQQEIERDLRKELKERREQGEDVVSYSGEVRPRQNVRGFRM